MSKKTPSLNSEKSSHHKIVFEKKVGLELIGMVPAKTIDSIRGGEWTEFLKLFVPHKKVKVTFEWEA